jgi:hypothetical protein
MHTAAPENTVVVILEPIEAGSGFLVDVKMVWLIRLVTKPHSST